MCSTARTFLLTGSLLWSFVPWAHSQPTADTLRGLELRSVGPALMGGRIADIAVHPERRSTWYLAVGSGGVWKTENAGVTWTPIFDDEHSYSIGTIALDPSSPDVVWVGTGENVSGRHVGWGDGVYKSLDGGGSWARMGLERSEHIGKILIDPRDGDVVYVAAEGPLWASGGERGLYKTVDGGKTWTESLVIDADTGITDVEMDPRDPDVLYAASYQRRRHVWSLLAGGPGSGVHKSTDAGETWRRLEGGLPDADMGKIGLAVSIANPDVVYATIESDDEHKGLYRSRDRGERWEHRSDYTSGGTGPHYYQEIEASPHDVDHVYQMDVFLHVSRDGGATFDVLGTGREKHSDNHALWIDPDDPRHLLAGTDASLYESFDDGVTWRQFPNLPISQFYKLALDTSEPFYSIVGGAQDLGTLIGPARTNHTEGVRNRDWYVPLGADGYDTAVDPNDPSTVYMETQGGNLWRYDRDTHEMLDIRPIPAPGGPPERFNWDAPIVISPHDSSRVYFGSQRVWRSDDRGDSWRTVSGDLTRDRNRYELELIDRVWSVDALYDNGAMSLYGTITTMSESPVAEGVLYVGTDDGRVQVTEDGGATWRDASIPDVPELAFVNDIQASQHDPDAAFVVLDAHKLGDFRPLLFETRDRGRTWTSIAGDLADDEIVWALEQDHEVAELLFLGAERGVYASTDGGATWVRLSGGVPTIAFRDIELHRGMNDLVGATFGRGFYVLDDYGPLRDVAAGALEGDAHLFAVRDAWQYTPSVPNQARGKPSMGSDDFATDNPPYGAVLTYFLKEAPRTAQAVRREQERALREAGEDVPFPGYEKLAEESLELEPFILFTVRDASGAAVRRIKAPANAGVHRASWDLRLPPPDAIDLRVPGFVPPWAGSPRGPYAPAGTYEVEMAIVNASGLSPVGEPRSFEVKRVHDASPDGGFQTETADLLRRARGASEEIARAEERLRYMREALTETPRAEDALWARLDAARSTLASLRTRLVGDRVRGSLNEASEPSILNRLGRVASGHWDTLAPPTATQRESVAVARAAFETLSGELRTFLGDELTGLAAALEAAGAPWTPGRTLPR